jgi:hypothetical protein
MTKQAFDKFEAAADPRLTLRFKTNVVTLSARSTSWFSRLLNFRDHVLYRVELPVRQLVDDGQELIISVVLLCLLPQVFFAGRKLSAAKIPSHVLALCHVSLAFFCTDVSVRER